MGFEAGKGWGEMLLPLLLLARYICSVVHFVSSSVERLIFFWGGWFSCFSLFKISAQYHIPRIDPLILHDPSIVDMATKKNKNNLYLTNNCTSSPLFIASCFCPTRPAMTRQVAHAVSVMMSIHFKCFAVLIFLEMSSLSNVPFTRLGDVIIIIQRYIYTKYALSTVQSM